MQSIIIDISKEIKMKPSDFLEHPYDSVLKNNECEIVARNIMVILFKTGNKFRNLKFQEYKNVRLKDGNFSENENILFDKVIGYCVSTETARLFSPVWNHPTS
jgi:hypothetical protein